MLCYIFGFDKYEHITTEFAIKKTYCDVAVKVDEKVPILFECKAAGLDLKDDHVRQATNYSADSGIDWVVLTNGLHWRVYKIIFAKPIDKQLVYEFKITDINTKKHGDLELLYYLCLESFLKSSKATLNDLHAQKQILNRYIIGQVMMTKPVVDSIRKTLKKLFPEIKADNEELYEIIHNEIFKREIIEGEPASDAEKSVARAERRAQQSKTDRKQPAKEE